MIATFNNNHTTMLNNNHHLPVTIRLAELDDTLPPLLVAKQVYAFSSDDVMSGISRVLVWIPTTLLGNDPDPIFHW